MVCVLQQGVEVVVDDFVVDDCNDSDGTSTDGLILPLAFSQSFDSNNETAPPIVLQSISCRRVGLFSHPIGDFFDSSFDRSIEANIYGKIIDRIQFYLSVRGYVFVGVCAFA